MKPARTLCRLTTVALSLPPLVAAWPTWLPELDSLIVRRDDSDSATSATSPQPTATETATSSAAAKTSDATATTSTSTSKKNQVETTNLNTGGRTASGTATGTAKGTGGTRTSSKKKTSSPTHTSFDARDPPGSVVMVTPAVTAGSQLYKIGDYITWGWNYTDLQGTPTAVDVLVSCSIATETWTLTQNMTFVTAGSFTWDTNQYQQTAVGEPLLTEKYTLVIYDAESSISATAEAGYLAPFTGFQFAMYSPQAYVPLNSWQCATCSAAMGDTEKRAIGFVLTMAVITVFSFTWFVTGLW